LQPFRVGVWPSFFLAAVSRPCAPRCLARSTLQVCAASHASSWLDTVSSMTVVTSPLLFLYACNFELSRNFARSALCEACPGHAVSILLFILFTRLCSLVNSACHNDEAKFKLALSMICESDLNMLRITEWNLVKLFYNRCEFRIFCSAKWPDRFVHEVTYSPFLLFVFFSRMVGQICARSNLVDGATLFIMVRE